MMKLGNQVRLSTDEKSGIEAFTGETIAPKTAEDVKAWLDVAGANANPDSAEERLMAAVFAGMKREL